MTHDQILHILEKTGALISEGHFQYTSGRHGKAYVNKDALYPHVDIASAVGRAFAERFTGDEIDVVVGPALGGIILSQWTAHHLSRLNQREVLSVYAEKVEDTLALKRGYDKLVRGKKVLVVEDVVTTGSSVDKTMTAIRNAGGHVFGVAVICNRGGLTLADLKDVTALYDLAKLPLDSWAPQDCPLCKDGIALSGDFGKAKRIVPSGPSTPSN